MVYLTAVNSHEFVSEGNVKCLGGYGIMMTYIKSAINNNIKSYYSNHANSKPSFTAPTELIKTNKTNTKKSINAILIFQKCF